MLKIDLITGFLGSGKTTFLLKYARYLMKQGLKLGILEYDYGAINVDMVLVGELRGPQCELEMLAAGCDEDCIKRRFRTKLISMAMSGYDRVIVEPSGVFDMDMFYDCLRDEPLERMYEIGSVITVVNGNLREDMGSEENFFLASQAVSAGVILLSRTQLSSSEQILAAKAHIETAAANINVPDFKGNYFEKDWNNLEDEDFRRIMNSGYHVRDYVKKIAGDDNGFSSLVFMDIPNDLEGMKSRIRELLSVKEADGKEEFGNILRVKGFLSDGINRYQINATTYEENISLVGKGKGILIVIGTELNKENISHFLLESE